MIRANTVVSFNDEVQIQDVESKPELNGEHGTIVRKRNTRKGSRWAVKVNGFPEAFSFKADKLKLLTSDEERFFPGAGVLIQNLQSKTELNGRSACLVNLVAADRWAVQLGGPELGHVSVKRCNLELLSAQIAPPLSHSNWDENIAEIDALASFLVRDFVEGPGCYPVLNMLERVKYSHDSEEIFPASTGKASVKKPHTAATWSDLPKAESERLFYKLSLSIRCSELVFYFAEMVMRLGENPRFQGTRCGGSSRNVGEEIFPNMFICVGYVKHQYRKLRVVGDFGQNHWQHSTLVHNKSRNHTWIEFIRSAEEDHGDPRNRVIIDLAAAQFDARTPGKSFLVTSGLDARYHKCYETPLQAMPVQFGKWMCLQNVVKFDGLHLVENIKRLLRDYKLTVPLDGRSYHRPCHSCLDAHKVLLDILLPLEARNFGGVGPGVLNAAVERDPKFLELEEDCGVTMTQLIEWDQKAFNSMMRAFGTEAFQREGVP